MISGTFTVLAVLVGIVYYIYTKSQKQKNAIPGPRSYPLVGNLLQLEKLQHITLCKWAKEFGPIFQMEFGTTKNIVVSDHKMVKEMFAEAEFSGRMDFSFFDLIPDGKLHGVVNTEGEHWEELRRFTLRQLRDFGFGKQTMEESIMLEVNELIEMLQEEEGQSVSNIKERFMLAVVIALWFIVSGVRHKQNDARLLEMITRTNDSFNSIIDTGGLLLFFPIFGKIMPKFSGYTYVKEQLKILEKYFRAPVEEHKKTYSENFDRDFIDTFLKEIKKTNEPNSAFRGSLGEDHLVATLFDLYFAGSDTTSTTLAWMILYMSKMPEIQKNFQEEMEFITGNSRLCSVTDRPNMPYTEALIAETLRFSSITPIGGTHKALKDQEFKGYMIPKDSLLTANMYFIHHDPRTWGDPENFRPERFLSPDGKTFKKHEALLAFSTGRRQCIGESLARDSIFLFSTNIFQRFWVDFDKNGPDNGWESTKSFILTPKPFNVVFKDRLGC